jgi:hypothetical protein
MTEEKPNVGKPLIVTISNNFKYRGVLLICSCDIKYEALLHAKFERISFAYKKLTQEILYSILLAVFLH